MLPGVTAFYLFGGLGRLEDSYGLEVNLGCIVRLGECLKVLFFFFNSEKTIPSFRKER